MSAAVEPAGQSVLDWQERDRKLRVIRKIDLIGRSKLELRRVVDKGPALRALEEVDLLEMTSDSARLDSVSAAETDQHAVGR